MRPTPFPFSQLPAYPGDPILSLMQAFQADTRPQKASLGIGVYFDDQGRLPVLDCVKAAETALLQAPGPRPYLPMEGTAPYRSAVQELLFGADHPAVQQGRIATIQTLGGSGGLKVGADLLKHFFPATGIWVSDPTWENHHAIFEGAGLSVKTYPYYDAATGGIRFDALCETLSGLPRGSAVLLHASCHNPTGVDLTEAQWRTLVPLLADRGLLPFVDIAYQGFGDGLREDAMVLRLLADAGISFLVANSFSKNFSLYGERCGALSVVCEDRDTAAKVLGQLQATVRRNYSTPPTHGARVVTQVLTTPELRASWEAETATMRARMRSMREQLHMALSDRLGGKRDLGFLLTQRGMFSYTGLSAAQVDRLREDHGVYLVRSGRLCISGLTTSNVQYVAQAIAAVIEA